MSADSRWVSVQRTPLCSFLQRDPLFALQQGSSSFTSMMYKSNPSPKAQHMTCRNQLSVWTGSRNSYLIKEKSIANK
jgi:hypothetical protein